MRWKTFVRSVAAAALAVSLPASAEDIPLAGSWAVASGEKTFLVVTLADADDDGAIDGATVESPKTMSLASGNAASNVAGPGILRSSRAVYPSGDSIIAIIAARRPDAPDDVYMISRLADDQISFAIPGYPFPPLTLKRAEVARVSAEWDADATYQLDGQGGDDNGELAKLFADDQAARSSGLTAIDWSAVAREDNARRVRVREMIDAGEVKTGADYHAAAFVFQHGDGPEDYLLAHALAVTAVAKGYNGAAWIAAATLDRFLQNIERAQIYGTQFQTSPDGKTTQGKYDSALVSDSMREASRVPPLAEQEAQRKMFEEQAQSRATGN